MDWYNGSFSPTSSEHNNILNLEPGFSNSAMGDYTLLPNSPAIDAGDPMTVNEIGWDGYTPLQADIGAFETELFVKLPGDIFQESNGLVVMEAEHFTWDLQHSEESHWSIQSNLMSYTGTGYLSALPDIDKLFTTTYTSASPELQYTVDFTTTGTYTVWLRGYAPNAAGDSIYISLDDQPATVLTGFEPGKWSWSSNTNDSSPATFEITQPGLHTLRLWQREDGLRIDRILLTRNKNYNPDGVGPVESDHINYLH